MLASTAKLAHRIAKILRSQGVDVLVVQRARDLGIGHGAGTKRAAMVATTRLKKVKPRVARVRNMSKVNRAAKKLYTTGVKPQMAWGHQAVGTPPTRLKHERTLAVKCLGFKASGACATTLVALGLGVFMFRRMHMPRRWCRTGCSSGSATLGTGKRSERPGLDS